MRPSAHRSVRPAVHRAARPAVRRPPQRTVERQSPAAAVLLPDVLRPGELSPLGDRRRAAPIAAILALAAAAATAASGAGVVLAWLRSAAA